MDNTELHFLTYDPEEIWADMISNYIDAGGDFLYPGDEKEMLLRSVQADIVQVFAGVDNALRMQTLRCATGEYLDIYGENRNCPRIEATSAKATVTITVNATGEESALEAGTKMTADGQLFYTLDEDLTLSGYAGTLTASISCEKTGTIGNALTAGTELALAISNSIVSSIIVATDAAGGNEKEDQETYRERIRQSGLSSVTTGPQNRYESVAKAVSSEILDARAINTYAGKVDVYLLLDDSTEGSAIIQSVLNALSRTDVRPLTDQVDVQQAEDITYTLNVFAFSDCSNAVKTAIASALSDYQEWQDNTIGRAFNPDKLKADIYSAGAIRVLWGYGSNFNSGDVTYTEISDSQRCKGTIFITHLEPDSMQSGIILAENDIDGVLDEEDDDESIVLFDDNQNPGSTGSLQITTQPQSIIQTQVGQTVQLSVAVSGTGTPDVYKWYEYGKPQAQIWNEFATHESNSMSDSISIESTESGVRIFRCKVRDTYGSAVISGISYVFSNNGE